MHRSLAILSTFAFVISAVGAIGCSSSSGSTTPDTSDSGSSSGGDTVSFKKDVMPFFQSGCTLTTQCHGQPNNASEENLFLGNHDMLSDPNSVYPMLVNVKAVEDPAMALITPGDTAKSFLFHKLVGDQNTFAADCMAAPMLCSMDCNASQPCGQFMPYNGVELGPSDYAVVENWIKQGALNN
jgi:hypothetical protein